MPDNRDKRIEELEAKVAELKLKLHAYQNFRATRYKELEAEIERWHQRNLLLEKRLQMVRDAADGRMD